MASISYDDARSKVREAAGKTLNTSRVAGQQGPLGESDMENPPTLNSTPATKKPPNPFKALQANPTKLGGQQVQKAVSPRKVLNKRGVPKVNNSAVQRRLGLKGYRA